MITIKKNVEITIDGGDVKTLSDICDLARQALNDDSRRKLNFDERKIVNFSREIWERIGLLD